MSNEFKKAAGFPSGALLYITIRLKVVPPLPNQSKVFQSSLSIMLKGVDNLDYVIALANDDIFCQ